MKELIDIFNMEELEPETRASLIIKMGRCIAYNLTESIVYDLVKILCPSHEILELDAYKNAR